MSAAKVKANTPHRLIVEARDDQWSIIELTAKHGWNWENPDPQYPYIEDAQGNTLALEALPVALRSHQRVGIVLDADITPGDRWQSLGDRLSGTQFRGQFTYFPRRDASDRLEHWEWEFREWELGVPGTVYLIPEFRGHVT